MKIKTRFLFVLLGLAAIIAGCSQRHKSKPVSKTVKPKAVVIQDSVKKVTIVEPDLKKLVDELNLRLDLYDSIAVNYDYTKAELAKFKLSTADRDSLVAQNEEHISGSSLASTCQFVIYDLFKGVLNHPAIKNYQLGDILHIEIVVSDNKKVFNITLPENTGGTYQSNLSWIHYRADDGKIYNYYPEQLIAEHDSISKPAFNIDGFSRITAIHTAKGTKYLFMGGVIGCSTCRIEYAELGYFDRGETILDFSFSIQSRFREDDDDKGIS
ncbi:hypothetical protein AAFN85_00505 [Mucilaginibacter sp. CAU 1740]|uniref:hypothetical protein n=1 Tax=Mucilaginibacter sp. CAU 1740 TaxID=3140365 RepID=UPI00325A8ACF